MTEVVELTEGKMEKEREEKKRKGERDCERQRESKELRDVINRARLGSQSNTREGHRRDQSDSRTERVKNNSQKRKEEKNRQNNAETDMSSRKYV